MPRASIHLKVMLLIGAVLCLLLGATGYFAVQNEKRFLTVESEKRTRNLRRALEALGRLALTTGEEGPLREYLFRLAQEDPDIQSIRILDARDRLLFESPGRGEPPDEPPERSAGPGELQTSPIYVDGRYAGRVEVAFDAASIRQLLARTTGLVVAAAVDSLLFLGLILHLALKHFVTRPLEGFIAGSHRIAAGDFGATIDTSTHDELADLAAAFNHMSAKLEQYRAEIEADQRDLEERVRERTTQLHSQMERARQLSLQVQHADRLSSLGTLAAGVAHELNNPIGNVSTFVQILQEKDRVPPELLSRCLQNIERETERASQIVRKLLEFARHEPARIEPVTPASLFERALSLLGSSFRDGGVEVVLELDPGLPELPVDASAIVQVLVNLMTNALHAMPEGGTLTLGARREPGGASLRVTDSGTGIAPDDLGRLFDPFFTTKEIGKGTGLGLSVSYGIVREHGGRIDVESAPGRGSEFRVYLPESAVVRDEGSYEAGASSESGVSPGEATRT